ncbi:MAG: hypothetical protein AAE987_05525 [Thermoplasmataceae archaeon]|jgi:hypothetical protein
MIKTPKRFGSFIGGVVVALILIPFFALISVYAIIFAGLIAGIVSRGVARGVLSTIIAGFVLVAVVITLAVLNGDTFLYNTMPYFTQFAVIEKADTDLYVLVLDSTLTIVEKTMFYLVLIPAVGGLIGGLIRPGY